MDQDSRNIPDDKILEHYIYTDTESGVTTKFGAKSIGKFIETYGKTRGVLKGKGNFGKVYAMTVKDSGGAKHRYAIKQSPYKTGTDAELKFVQDLEKSLLIKHPNLLCFFGACEHDNKLYIIMELMKGTLADFRRRLLNNKDLQRTTSEIDNNALPETIVSRVLAAVADGLIYLYSHLRYHCDIKVANVLYSKTTIKLADFGAMSNRATASISGGNLIAATRISFPPEMVGGNILANQALDIWALGVLVYEFALGEHPIRAACGDSDPRVIDMLQKLKSLTLSSGCGFPLPTGLYSDELRSTYDGMAATDPLFRTRYLTKNSDDETKNDAARNPNYRGPDNGLVDNQIVKLYCDAGLSRNLQLRRKIDGIMALA